MSLALNLAAEAERDGEVPVGAVVVSDGVVIGRGYNRPIATSDPTAHAEIVALRDAALQQQNYRLPDTTLYVTLEPCTMCAGAIIQSRIARLVFGAYDTKAGACGSIVDILGETQINHHTTVLGGVMADRCALILQEFFQRRRNLNH